VRLKWTRAAERDLALIEQYISRDNPGAAIDTVLEIIRHINVLAGHPGIGRPGRVEGTRELAIAGLPYVVLYVIEENGVIVLRVLHGAMKWPERF
jgi:toxin ParE1/3/4